MFNVGTTEGGEQTSWGSEGRHGFFITINSMILYFKHIIHIVDSPLPPTGTRLASKQYTRPTSSFVSFTHFFPTCGRMPLPALSLWPGRQSCRPRLVGDMRGGGPSSVTPCSRNPPTGRRRDSPISSSSTSVKRFERSNGLDNALYKNYLYLSFKLFSHGPPLCAGLLKRALSYVEHVMRTENNYCML